MCRCFILRPRCPHVQIPRIVRDLNVPGYLTSSVDNVRVYFFKRTKIFEGENLWLRTRYISVIMEKKVRHSFPPTHYY